jgi:hypothetical protein
MQHEHDDEEDPSVPSDLLELYVELEEASITPEEFKEKFSGLDSKWE